MKHTLIPLALAAVAMTAAADNAITFSGDLKVAGAYGNGGSTPIDGTAANHWRLNDFSSYLGVSGKQDLPHGLTAGFELDGFVSVDTGQTWSDGGGTGPLFSRRAVVTLDGDFGRVFAGRAFTPAAIMVLFSDPWYWDGSAAQVGWQVQQANYTSTSYLRTNNTLGFISRKIDGFTLSVSGAAGENTSSKDLGASLTYAEGPLWAGVAYDQSHGFTNDQTLNHMLTFVAGYDFGVVHPTASYTSSKVLGEKYSSFSIAATAPAGPDGLVKFEMGHMNDFDTALAGKQAYNKVAVGYQYNVTKSANAFGDLARAKGEGDSATNTIEIGVEYGF